MSELKLGQLIEDEQDRDAIHVAVAPVVAAEKLSPGQDVGFVQDGKERRAGKSDKPIGIVDPYLNCTVVRGEKFWLFLYPNTVTGMRHHWAHPEFDSAGTVSSERPVIDESIAWLERFAEEAGLSYSRMIEITNDFLDTGEVWVEGGSERARDAFYESEKEFWFHFENVTGRKPSGDEGWGAPFSCSC